LKDLLKNKYGENFSDEEGENENAGNEKTPSKMKSISSPSSPSPMKVASLTNQSSRPIPKTSSASCLVAVGLQSSKES
jgi:hypothetical protein